MAVLIAADRQGITTALMAAASAIWSRLDGLTKAELRAAVDAADQWAEDNAASFNSALPLPARTALTPKQKAWLLALTIMRRYEVS